MSEYLFFRMKRVEKRQIAQVGRLKLYETDYVLQQTTERGENVLRVDPPDLLPRGEEFITIDDAAGFSGLRVSEIKRLCKRGVLYSKRVSGTLMIETESLKIFLKR